MGTFGRTRACLGRCRRHSEGPLSNRSTCASLPNLIYIRTHLLANPFARPLTCQMRSNVSHSLSRFRALYSPWRSCVFLLSDIFLVCSLCLFTQLSGTGYGEVCDMCTRALLDLNLSLGAYLTCRICFAHGFIPGRFPRPWVAWQSAFTMMRA